MVDNNEILKENENNTEVDSNTKIFDKHINEIINGKENVFEDVFEDISSSSSDEKSEEVTEEQQAQEQEDLYAETSGKKKKNKKGMPVIVRVLIILLVSFALATSMLFCVWEILGLKNPFGESGKAAVTEIVVEKNDTWEIIANKLKDKDIINSTTLFRLYVKLKHANDYKIGVHEVKRQPYDELIYTLAQDGTPANTVKVTIPEGKSVNEIAEIMESKKICTKSEFITAVKSNDYDYDFVKKIPVGKCYYLLEGYLFPATYDFYADTNEGKGAENAYKAVNRMLQRMDEELTDDVIKTAKKKGYTIHEVLTMASIVEAEASGYPKEMKNVAQVFYNRLRWTYQPARLGSSPTANYPDSRYNTNVNEGLPPGPICSPSSSAIKAALNPNTSLKADYFVTDRNMKFYYTNSLSEHNALIERLKSEGLWN